jgi:hypothetical protein
MSTVLTFLRLRTEQMWSVPVSHAVIKVDGPSHLTGGQLFDALRLRIQLEEASRLMLQPDKTDENNPLFQFSAFVNEFDAFAIERPGFLDRPFGSRTYKTSKLECAASHCRCRMPNR